jgi:hypothetical protein
MTPAQVVSDAAVALIRAERRLNPYFRNGFDRAFQRPLPTAIQGVMNLRRRDQHLGLAEERALPGEEQVTPGDRVAPLLSPPSCSRSPLHTPLPRDT